MINIQITVPPTKTDSATVDAIQTIAMSLSKDNLLAVAKKLKSNPDSVNKKLPMGLKFV